MGRREGGVVHGWSRWLSYYELVRASVSERLCVCVCVCVCVVLCVCVCV